MTQDITSAINRTTRTSRAILMASAFTLGGISAETTQELEELIVSALRMPGEASRATSAVTALDARELETRGILDLRQALNEVPGVIATSTSGQTGAIGSVFIRGTATPYSQLVVDGVRLSDSTAPLGNFLSGARLDDLGRIEVLRGAQAAIHGGEAVGGVIWLETARGGGDPQNRFRIEGGSFDSLNGFLSHSGKEGPFSWFLGAGYDGTHNDAVRQDFDQARASLRLEWAQSENLTLGMTYRVSDSRFQYENFGTNTDHTDSALTTVYADARIAPGWQARFTLGRYVESYDNDTEGLFGGNFGTDLDRIVLSTDQSFEINRIHRLFGGAFLEHSDFTNTFSGDVDEIRYGAHLGWEWSPVENFVTDAVVRWENYADYDDQVTWRVGASWQALEKTRLRGGIGQAFRTPTFLDLYGTAFGAGNPNLVAEESIGWDFGIEQRIGESHMVSVTWFENSITNRIRSNPTPPINLPGDTPTRGLEFALDGALGESVAYRLVWTCLGASLQDQPDHTGMASIDWRPSEKLLLGIGASYVDERSFGGGPLEDYLLLRLYGSYALRENVTIHARIENLADEGYELSNFFGSRIQGAGFGFFAGLTTEF